MSKKNSIMASVAKEGGARTNRARVLNQLPEIQVYEEYTPAWLPAECMG